jgi:hypothetical protein
MRRPIVIVVYALAGCGGGGGSSDPPGPADAGAVDAAIADGAPGPAFVPGDPIALTADSSGNEEDPAVLRARDGRIYVAWFSETAGNDILISRTSDGVTWSPPAHVSTGAATDFGPSLYQDAAGTIHAVWFRWQDGSPPGRILYNRSTAPDDGLSWDPASEVEVTSSSGTDDWVPSITADAGGNLVVAFARNTCPPPTCYGIAVTTSAGGTTWSTPAVQAATAGAGVEHHLPAIANIDGELHLAWDPFDEAAAVPWEGPATGAHISLITSTTGASWLEPRDVTARDPAAVSLFPTLYADHGGEWHLAWMTGDATGTSVVEVPLRALDVPPAALPIAGYSPRLVATPTPGVYLGAWVEGPPDNRDIVVRVFAR